MRGANNGISKKGGATPPASSNNIVYPCSANLLVKIAPAVPAPTEFKNYNFNLYNTILIRFIFV